MNVYALLVGLFVSTVAIADVITIDKDGANAVINGTKKGAASEVLRIISEAYEIGYKTSRGADIFEKTVLKEGKHSILTLGGDNIYVTRDAHLQVMYKALFKGRAQNFTVDNESQEMVLKGSVAKTLMGAMRLVIARRASHEEQGMELIQTSSGRVRCEKVIAPKAVAVCFLSL
jgi:hypothetical protein